MAPVDPEFRIKGYYYGKQLVPVSKALESEFKIETTKCLKLLAFGAESTDSVRGPAETLLHEGRGHGGAGQQARKLPSLRRGRQRHAPAAEGRLLQTRAEAELGAAAGRPDPAFC